MSLYLGVDGGGTKCHALVAESTGAVCGFGFSGPANWEEVGIEAAGAAIRSAVREALSEAGAKAKDVAASTFGLAGVDFPSDEARLAGIPEALELTGPHRIVNDSFVALRAGTDRTWGVVVIAGSGGVAAGRNPAGDTFRTLGQGPLFGDPGSASEVSEAAVTAVAEASIGKRPATSLTELLLEATGTGSPLGMIEGFARGFLDATRYAPLVFRASASGDRVAKGILESAGSAIGENAVLVARTLDMLELDFELVMSGGLFSGEDWTLVEALEDRVRGDAPEVKPIRLATPSVCGAALLAIELLEPPTGPDVHARLNRDAERAARGR